MNILLTTLGMSWQIIPELYGFTNPDTLELYANHPDHEDISSVRLRHVIQPVDEIWIITTDDPKTTKSLDELKQWHSNLTHKPVLRAWRAAGVAELGTATECRQMADLIFRAVLHAQARVGLSAQLLLSLAGGRKTMSADMQRAGSVFGCHAMLHVIDRDGAAASMRELTPLDFTAPLPHKLVRLVVPLVLSSILESDPMLDCAPGIRVDNFRLSFSSEVEHVEVSTALVDALDRIHMESRNLLANSRKWVDASSFPKLSTLPPRRLDELRTQMLGLDSSCADDEIAWLKRLPKAELHCHLGGVLSPSEMIEVAACLEKEFSEAQSLNPDFKAWLRAIREAVDASDLPKLHRLVSDTKGIRTRFPCVPEPFSVAAFLHAFKGHSPLLDEFIFGRWTCDSEFHSIGIEAYERIGDLQGSGLLQHEKTLRSACQALLRKARDHNLRYLELRCSPVNYTRGGFTEKRVAEILTQELSSSDTPVVKLIFIASRHGRMSDIHRHVELASELRAVNEDFKRIFVGFDLAGDESAKKPEDLRSAFLPLMEQCVRLTVHAGETEGVENIWQAVYHLGADRIGHGLRLLERPELLGRLADRRVAVELCPSSNLQIVGFQDNFLRETASLHRYPLKRYIDSGLRIAICTDNPGISRTDFTLELHRACRLTNAGLSKWDILRILRTSFRSTFAPYEERKELLCNIESEIMEIL